MLTDATSAPKKKSKSAKQPAGRRNGAARRPVRAEDLLRFQFVSEPRISPDGSRIVFVKKHVGEKNEYVRNLWMVDAGGKASEGGARQFTSGKKDAQPRWSPDGARIAFISERKKRRPQLYVIDARGGEATPLTKFSEGCISKFVWSPTGAQLVVAFREVEPDRTEAAEKQRKEKGLSEPARVIDDWWYRLDGDGYFGAQRHKLYIVDVETGAHRLMYEKDTLGDIAFDFSPDGRELAVTSNRHPQAMIRAWKTELLRINLRTGKIKSLVKLPAGPKSAVQWSPDGKYIAFAGREGEDGDYSVENLELWVCDADGGNARSLTAQSDYCLMAAALTDLAEVSFAPTFRWHPSGEWLAASIGWHGVSRIAKVPLGPKKAVIFLTDEAGSASLGNFDAAGRHLALTMHSTTEPEEICIGALGGKSADVRQRTSFNRDLLDTLAISEPVSEWIKSTDGASVQMWTMLPPDFKQGKKYPAVLEVHGGPHAQYGQGLFHEFQMLAGAGYIVFFSNPRGSKGYGRDHCAAIRGAWGTKDWEDIQAVTKHMQHNPFVDTRRMAIMGGSYGGYMTNWAIGHTNVFAAAITDRCVSNLHSMFGSSDYTEEPDRYFPGNAWDKPEKLWEMSPLKYFGNARTPTLIIHSEGDLRCNIEQAEQVFTALKLNKVPTRFVRYPKSTSHGMSRSGPPDLRLHRLQQILEWLKKWLG